MSLSASMWTSVSGLFTHGEKMNVIGNNIANVSTIGFKAQRADFSDFFYTNYGTASGVDQVGKGTSINALIGDFSQGGFENTNSATDLAINGNGFFKVRNDANGGSYYTRAGDFYFNTNRELVNPSGLIVQGWKTTQERNVTLGNGTITISNDDTKTDFRRTGVAKDVVLDKWNLPPERTANIAVANNLINDDRYDKCSSDTSPLTALFDSWNANNLTSTDSKPPLSDDAYATQCSIQAYDESGKAHMVTVYMDRVNQKKVDSSGSTVYEIDGIDPSYNVYEYLVTMDPTEDKRTDFQGSDKAGVLMSGVLVFDAAGQLVNQSAYTYNGSAAAETTDLSKWTTTAISNNGLPVFTANFSGKNNEDSIQQLKTAGLEGSDCLIELDFGLKTGTSTFNNNGGSLDDLKVISAKVPYNDLGLMNNPVRDDNATACNGTSFMTDIQDDGYPSGVLSNYNIDSEGVVYGVYSNGKSLPLYQLAMYDFHNLQGLYREGGNLYSATHESGAAVEGVAGTGTFGQINSYYIENSNVDMSREFVHMISCQRGFQANSKSITTTDTMLETVIGMKR